MSKPSWVKTLTQTLKRLQKPDRPLRVAIVGMGHELCGDDAAGIVVVRDLQAMVVSHAAKDLLIIDAGPAPENHTGRLRRFGVDLILLIDAAQMDEAPGAVCWLAWQDTTGLGGSTHTLPPHILVRYLMAEFGCEVALLGIQPANVVVGAPLSPTVQQVVDTIVQMLARMLFDSYEAVDCRSGEA